VQRSDRWVGIALALLGLAVAWSARSFPDVPGQKLGAGFLPMIVGVGLVACAIGLIARSFRAMRCGGRSAARSSCTSRSTSCCACRCPGAYSAPSTEAGVFRPFY
jgi:hypothetical protein